MRGWLVLAVFVVFSFPVLASLSRSSGWFRLAKRYAVPARAWGGHRSYFTSGRMGGIAFKGILTIGADPAVLYLALLPPFRPFHPPLMIPWTVIRRGWTSTMSERWGTLVIDDDVTLEVSKDAFDRLSEFLPRPS